MREFLFRGKSIGTEEWIIGGYARCNNREYILPDIDLVGREWVFKNIEVISETVGQFTGLIDKNRKKVFEGDIVKVNGVANAKIIYNENEACFAFDYGPNGRPLIVDLVEEHSIEVIGNIYDNPELLGE